MLRAHEHAANSYHSCKPGSGTCIGVTFHGKGCSAGATEKHNLAEGRCVRAMENGKADSSMLKASCSKNGTITVLEYENASDCSGAPSGKHGFKSGAQCSSSSPISTSGCGDPTPSRNDCPRVSVC